MTIVFTDEEIKYIIKDVFDWHISKDCPKKLKKDIENKLKMLNEELYSYVDRK